MNEGEDNLITFFRDVKQIFDENNVECWLIFGALLGMVREGKLLSWDTDIDVGIWDTDHSKIAKAIDDFHKRNITVHFSESGHVSFNRNKMHISALTYSRNGEYAERFTFTHTRKFIVSNEGLKSVKYLRKVTQMFKYFRWLTMKPEYVGDSPQFISNSMQKSLVKIFRLMPDFIRLKLKILVEIILGSGCAYFTEAVPAKYFSNLKSIDFYDMKVNIPIDSEGYLSHQFGDDWRTPKKDWVPAQLELVRDGKSIQKAWKLVKP